MQIKPGQILQGWFSDLMSGRIRTRDQLTQAVNAERHAHDAQSSDRFLFIPDDGPEFAAPARLRAPGFFLGNAHLDQMHKADWQQCDRRLMRWAAMTVHLARTRWQVPLYVHCAFRTKEEQARLKAQGRSKLLWPNGPHNNGEAVDIVHGLFHWDMSPQEWDFIHVLGLLALDRVNATLKKDEKLNLTWGGHWSDPWDPAHWEVHDYRTRVKPRSSLSPVRMTPTNILDKIRS